MKIQKKHFFGGGSGWVGGGGRVGSGGGQVCGGVWLVGGGQGGCECNVGGRGDVGYGGCEPRIEGIVQCTKRYCTILTLFEFKKRKREKKK